MVEGIFGLAKKIFIGKTEGSIKRGKISKRNRMQALKKQEDFKMKTIEERKLVKRENMRENMVIFSNKCSRDS